MYGRTSLPPVANCVLLPHHLFFARKLDYARKYSRALPIFAKHCKMISPASCVALVDNNYPQVETINTLIIPEGFSNKNQEFNTACLISELFDDGGLPSGISLSLNKKNRWMIPEIVEGEITERSLQNQENDGQMQNQGRKSSSISPRKKKGNKRRSPNHDDELPLKSVVIERNLLSHRTICNAVYSATNQECKMKKGKSW